MEIGREVGVREWGEVGVVVVGEKDEVVEAGGAVKGRGEVGVVEVHVGGAVEVGGSETGVREGEIGVVEGGGTVEGG